MIPRLLTKKLTDLVRGFPVICLTGPRQSGKTTLVKDVFRDYAYVSLEKITQSLAGRSAILHLMPFSAAEVEDAGLLAPDLDQVLFHGMYPPLFDRPVAPPDFYPSYIETYLERDVRSMKNIGDLALFRKFVLLCAGRVGQLLNLTSLGDETGVDHKTIRSWLSVLEAGFIVFLLRPHHRNWNKRVVKQPKLYFYDTGLLCSLLGLRTAGDLSSHHLRGSIYETYVISEHIKQQHHDALRPSAYFWRDYGGHEVDLIIEQGEDIQAVEIKSGETLNDHLFDGLRWFSKQTALPSTHCTLVYGGEETQTRAAGRVLPWKRAHIAQQRSRLQRLDRDVSHRMPVQNSAHREQRWPGSGNA